MGLLSSGERRQIEDRIAAIEARTAGELVVAVLDRSDGHVGPRALASAAWTLALTLLVHILAPRVGATWLLLGELALGWLTWRLCGFAPLLRRLIGARRAEAAVGRRALGLFAERGVYATRDRSGLLIVVSALERRVVILGDAGIHAHIGEAGWDGYVQQIIAGIRAGQAAPAILQVLDALGEALAAHFPPRPDDRDELPNTVIEA